MRAAGLTFPLYWSWTRRSSRGWTRVPLHGVALIVCLVQLWMPAHHFRIPDAAAHAAAISAEKLDVRCSQLGAHSTSDHGGDPAPCEHDDCPCCPLVYDAIGLLPQEPVRTAYLPLLSTIVAPPALLGSLANAERFSGQPRAPPTLI